MVFNHDFSNGKPLTDSGVEENIHRAVSDCFESKQLVMIRTGNMMILALPAEQGEGEAVSVFITENYKHRIYELPTLQIVEDGENPLIQD